MTQKSSFSPSGAGAASVSGGTTPSTPSTPRDDVAMALKTGVADRAHDLVDDVKHAADDLTGEAKKAAETRLSTGKDRVAQGLGSVATALRKTGAQLRNDDQLGITDYVVRAADGVESASDYFQQRTLGQVVGDLEQFARREPALFLGGAFVAGLLGGRFLKSTSRHPSGGRSSHQGHSGRNGTGPSASSARSTERNGNEQRSTGASDPGARPQGGTSSGGASQAGTSASTYGGTAPRAGGGSTPSTEKTSAPKVPGSAKTPGGE